MFTVDSSRLPSFCPASMVLQYVHAYLNGFPANLAEDCHGNMIKQAGRTHKLITMLCLSASVAMLSRSVWRMRFEAGVEGCCGEQCCW